MYGWIWRRLPGQGTGKVAVALGLVLLTAAVLWYVVFPWMEPKLRYDHGTVGGTSAPATPRPQR